MKRGYTEFYLKLMYIICIGLISILLIGFCTYAYMAEMYVVMIVMASITIIVCVAMTMIMRNQSKKMTMMYRLYLEGYLSDEFIINDLRFSKGMEEVFVKMLNKVTKEDKISNMSDNIHYLALQEQINPHFLYNTLEGIRGTALVAGLDDLAKMVENLAVFFRYTISQQKKLVTLEEEILNVEHYYNIQKFRFKERVNLEMVYDDKEYDEMLKYQVPKLILQPFIENAIIHGFEDKIEPGHITIVVEQTESKLLIRISDDGSGIEERKVVEMNRKLCHIPHENVEEDKTKKKNGIAIYNVNTRIKLLFGDSYGVRISSIKNYGTDIYIELPISERKDFESDEERDIAVGTLNYKR